MRIECLTVSVDTADYLAHTMPMNRSLFNHQLVITAEHDKETQRVCKHYNVECFLTEVFYEDGFKFNKGRAINAALLHLLQTGGFREWVVHMDADMVLPPLTRHILETIPLDEQFLYGIDRVMCPSDDHWLRFLQDPLPQHDQAYIHVGPFPVGTRLMKLEQGGWVPLGFFQLFHRNAEALKAQPYYPVEWDSAATSDLYFAYKWPRTHRHMIPEIVGIHLATDDLTYSAMGQNWTGRRTRRFGHRDPFYVSAGYRPTPHRDVNNE